ncbi:MAG: sigma factor G inhibitor Gin [Bacillota bacterium]|nr:hypothetical protein [Bacillota bacterium]HOB92311.1 sigma factor G inhibitor Gin [Bacillota bacterium]HPZ55403.1 sigma factor G inhibitor Gin [Bacillota bacterium]HQD18789.1 sigma factor G inhibitor Gin [Bacillota bacterium]
MSEHREETSSCLVCKRSAVDGIYVGWKLICQDCESRIVNTKSTDPDYGELLQAVKSLWRMYCDNSDISGTAGP